MVDVSVIIPCFNEEKNIEAIASQLCSVLRENDITGEVIFVNDGSQDRTAGVIERLCRRYNNILGVTHEHNQGIPEAWFTGVQNAHGKYIVTTDADLQYDPSDITLLYQTMISDNCDLVQAWRKNSSDTYVFRKLLSTVLSWFLNLLFLTHLPDIKSGFVMYRKEVFSDILADRTAFRTFQHFFILSALSKGYRMQRIPITFRPRKYGASFIKNPIFFSLKVLLDIPKAVLLYKTLRKRRK